MVSPFLGVFLNFGLPISFILSDRVIQRACIRLGKEFSLDKGFTVFFNAWATRKQEGKLLEGRGQYGKVFVVPSELSTVCPLTDY